MVHIKPNGYEKTLAEMSEKEREGRKKIDSSSSLQIFAEWYKNNK